MTDGDDNETGLGAADQALLNQGLDEAPEAADETKIEGAEPVVEGEPDEDDQKPEDEPEGRERRSKPAHVRIAELTAKLRQAERDRDAALNGKQPADEVPRDSEAPSSSFTEAEPDPEALNDDGSPKYEFGEADPKFMRDLARYEGRKAYFEEKDADRAKAADDERAAQAADLDGKWNEQVTKGAEKYEDFNQVVLESAAAGDWECPPLVAAAISVSPVGADAAYHLAKHPDEAAAIAQQLQTDPVAAATRFGEIEGQFLDEIPSAPTSNHPLDVAIYAGRLKAALTKGTTPAKPAAVVDTKAPVPPKHTLRGSGGKFDVSDDTEDFASFERKVMSGKK